MSLIEIEQKYRRTQDRAIQNLLEQDPQHLAQWDNTKFLLRRPYNSHFLIRSPKNVFRTPRNCPQHQNFPAANASIFSESKNVFPKMIKSRSLIKQNSRNQKPHQLGYNKRYKQYQTSRGQDLKIAAYNTQYKWTALENKSKGFQVSVSSVMVDSFCPQSNANTEQVINFNNFIGPNTQKNVKIRQFISKMKRARKQSNGWQANYQLFQKIVNKNDQQRSSEKISDIKKTNQNFFRYSPRKIRQSHKPLKDIKIQPSNAQIVGFSYFKRD